MFVPEFFFLIYAVLEVERLLPRADMWRHSTKLVFSEPLCCVVSRMASSASRYFIRETSATSSSSLIIQSVCV